MKTLMIKDMKYLVGLIFLVGALNLDAQTQRLPVKKDSLQTKKINTDTLVKYGGIKIPVYIRNTQQTYVYYSLISKPSEILKIDRKEVEKIIYRTGKVDVFNNAAFEVIEEGRWETVLITQNKKDVEGLYKRREVSSVSSPQRSKKKAKENAYIKLQKTAANAGATIVLVTDEEFFGGYGDNPGYSIKGIAYGTEPLEEGTNVVEDPAKKTTPSGQKSGSGTTTNQGQNKTSQSSQQKTGATQQTGNQQKTGTTQQKTGSGTQQKTGTQK